MADTTTSAKKPRDYFSTRIGFVLAAVGSAVGLGNIWRFPYITGEHGGGAFVLVYILCIALIGIPVLYGELVVGRRGGRDIVGALRALTEREGAVGKWASRGIGFLAIVTSFVVLSFYSVVAGWTIHFFLVGIGVFPLSPDGAATNFSELIASGWLPAAWHTIFMLLTIFVVAHGIHGGIEKLTLVLMPALLVILIGLLIYVGITGGLGQSLAFLFQPDFGRLSGEGFLVALGQAFFTLSLGLGIMVTYGSYLREEQRVVRDSVWIALSDTVVALLAGAVVFAVVFRFGAEPAQGPGLVFATLPDLFAQIPGGAVVAGAFFLLLLFAAWTSAVSLLEVGVAFFVDERNLARRRAAWSLGGAIWIVGLASAFWSDVLNFFDALTGKLLMPLGGLLIALAAGWLVSRVDRESGFAALERAGPTLAAIWTVLIRYVTPVLIVVMLIANL